MENPYVSVIGHLSGRLIGERDAYELDVERVLEAAAETVTAIEINAYPLRLDLSESYVRVAKEKNVRLVISTDSHVQGQFENMRYGVAVARRGWLEKKDVLNTLPAGALLKKLKKKK
jgi:DNA polymerase (family 10)